MKYEVATCLSTKVTCFIHGRWSVQDVLHTQMGQPWSGSDKSRKHIFTLPLSQSKRCSNVSLAVPLITLPDACLDSNEIVYNHYEIKMKYTATKATYRRRKVTLWGSRAIHTRLVTPLRSDRSTKRGLHRIASLETKHTLSYSYKLQL